MSWRWRTRGPGDAPSDRWTHRQQDELLLGLDERQEGQNLLELLQVDLLLDGLHGLHSVADEDELEDDDGEEDERQPVDHLAPILHLHLRAGALLDFLPTAKSKEINKFKL